MKNHLWKRALSMLLLMCMLAGLLPAGASATEEAVDSRAGGSTLSQEARTIRTQINGLSTPQYTHNEKHHWDTDSDWGYGKWYKMPEGVTGAYIFVNAESGYAINPVYDSSGKWFKATQTTTDGDSVYGVGLDASHGLTLVHPNNSELANYRDHGCYCIQVPNGKYVSASSDRFHFVNTNNIYYNVLVRDYAVFIEMFFNSVSHCYVSDSTGTKMDASANNNAANASKKNTFYMYRLKTLPGLTELYDAIKDADWYLDGGISGEEQYAQLLTILRQSVDLYTQSNTYQTNKTPAQVKELDYDLKGQAIALKEAVENVRLTMEVTDLAARVTAQIATLTQPGTYNKLVDLREQQSENKRLSTDVPLNALQKGGYLAILHRNSSYDKFNHRAEYYLLDGTAGGVGSVVSGKKVQIANNTILGDISAQFLQIEHRNSNAEAASSQQIKFTDGNYLLRTPDESRNYLVFKGKNTNTSTDTNLDDHFIFSYSPDGRHVVFYNPQGHGLSFNGTNFQWTSYYRDNIGKNFIKFYFFRQWSTNALFDTITGTVKNRLNDPTQYTEGNYRHFLNCYERCIDMYKLVNDVYPKADILTDDIFTTTIEDLIDELKSCDNRLFNTNMEYIDIPVEMLDFRADGFMFESGFAFKSAYSMSYETKPIYDANGNEVASFPGKVDKGDNWTAGSYSYSIKELILPNLVNGKIAYRQETVNYIAHALYQAKLRNATTASSDDRVKHIAPNPQSLLQKDANKAFIAWHQEALRDLGDWDETLAKDGGQNGGKMTWTDVETYYDMAYYMLTYMWQSVPRTSGNVLETKDTNSFGGQDLYYNMVVPERTTMRLYKGETDDYYHFGSYEGYSFAGGVMYNNGLSKLSGSPGFNPVRNVGFADETYFGNRSTGATYLEKYTYRTNANFYFTMHAHGSFIYYEDSDLYFDFTGDDDVYFFIKDTLVCDLGGVHGAPQEVIKLNDVNKTLNLGLKNGDICNFDMFYGDRHTGDINLKLKTNIQIMNEDVLTSKGQYGEVLNGASQIDKNGVGKELENNAMVDVGARIAYSLELLNKGTVPVNKLTFIDNSLGVTLSPDRVTLGTAEQNGIATKVSDLILFYRSTNGTTVDGSEPADITYDELLSMINDSNDYTVEGTQPVFNTFPEGSYRLTNVTQDQLMALMALGLPRNCQISIYGFKRNTTEADYPNYKNTLETVCYDAYAGGSALRGMATRYLQVPDVNAPKPTVDIEHLVIDYGKAVHIPLTELRAHIYDNAKARVGDFVGLTLEKERYNGETLKEAPADLTTSAVTTTFGTFTVADSAIVYTPEKFLTDTETIFAVFELNGYYGFTAAGNSFEYPYILVEIRVTPATMVYYEAEDFAHGEDDPIDSVIVENKTETGKWGTKEQQLPMDIDRDNIPEDAIFFDFDGTGHEKRYRDNPIYDSIDFDYVESWYKNFACVSGHTIQDGALKLTFNENLTPDYRYIQSVVPGVTSFEKDNPLRFQTSADHYVQVRFRLTDCVRKYDRNMYFTLYFSDGANPNDNINSTYTSDSRNYAIKSIDVDKALSGEYVTMLLPLSKTSFYTGVDFIDAVRMQIDNVNPVPGKTGVIEFDYLYVGPYIETKQDLNRTVDTEYDISYDREYAPTGAFFADFDGDGYDARYKNEPQYNRLNFDLADYWWTDEDSGDSIATTVDTNAGTLTLNVSDFHNNGGYGPYLGTGKNGSYPTVNSVNSLPLSYIPTEHDFVELRFKVENCKIEGGWVQFLYIYEKTDGSVAYQEINGCDFTTSENGKYQTLTFPVREYTQYYSAERIKSFAFRFRNIRADGNADAKVVIDYIYVGPEFEADVSRDTTPPDYLYFTFDGAGAHSLRYENPIYGGIDFDNLSNWADGTASKIDKSQVGILSIGDNDSVDVSRTSVWAHTGINYDTSPLAYVPGERDVCQIRFEVSGATCAHSDGTSYIRIDFYKTNKWETGNATDTRYFKLADYNNKGYFTLTFPITTEVYRQADKITAIRPLLGGVRGGTFNIDYLYIGPMEGLRHAMSGSDRLYFDFTDTTVDAHRYSGMSYGEKNYDVAGSWVPHEATATVVGEALHFSGLTNPNGWAVLYTHNDLNYVPHEDDYIQARIRVVNGSPLNGDAEFGIHFGDGANRDLDNFVGFRFHVTDASDWITLSAPIKDAPYQYSKVGDPNFTEFEKITFIAPKFSQISKTSDTYYEIDYLYIGPKEEANPVADGLFFDFDDTATDHIRYNTDTYGYANFDIDGSWSVETKRDGSVVIMPEIGVAVIDPHSSLSTGSFASDFSYMHTGAQITDHPLDFHPGEADIAQFRFKLEGERTSTDAIQAYLYYGTDNTTPAGGNYSYAGIGYVSAEKVNTGEYVTVTFALNDAFRNANIISNMRVGFAGLRGATGLVLDYAYVGPGEIPPTVYGYDSGYLNDDTLSNGESLFVEGKGVKLDQDTKNYTETYFSFTGTGFDLISRTGKQQGTIRVSVFSDEERTDLAKALTVANKGELELYQIPVASIQGLPYGTYHVTVGVNEAATYGVVGGIDMSFMSRGGEFYFDAIRIYDPIDVSNPKADTNEQIALDAYMAHKEAYANIKEVRNILLSAEDFNALIGSTEGAVFMDVKSSKVQPDGSVNENVTYPTDLDGDDYITADIRTYNKIGPKNEVYLAPSQAVAFKLQIDPKQTPESLDIGVKIIDGSTAKLAAGIVGKDSSASDVLTITDVVTGTIEAASAQYYPLTMNNIIKEADGSRYVYVVILNNSVENGLSEKDQVLSVTDIKVAYGGAHNATLPEDNITDPEVHPMEPTEPTEPTPAPGGGSSGGNGPGASDADIKFLVDGNTVQAVRRFLKALHETPVDTTPTMVNGISIYHSLNLASDISINYAVPVTQLEGYEDITMKILLPTYEGNNAVGAREVLLQPVENGYYYYFTLTGLTAVNIGDSVKATLHMTKDGKNCYTATDTYSVAQYAYSQLSKDTVADSLKTVCADLLRYGAKAQIFKGYRTDSLADSAMTEEQQAYLSDMDAVTFGNVNRDLNDLPNAPISWAGKTLNLESKVSLKFVFNPAAYAGDLNALSLRVSYQDAQGTDKTAIVGQAEPYGQGTGLYAFTFDGFLAAELRSVVSVRIYAGETPLSSTLQYSADTYGNNKTGTLLDLCKALFAYSDSAKAFFA